jgi:Uma2 family endonuclease
VAAATVNVRIVDMGTWEHPPARRFTADEAMRMVDAGILRKDEPLELLDGRLVEVSPQGPMHAAATTKLAKRLDRLYPESPHIRQEKPLATSEHDLPEPDIAVIRGRDVDYTERHPTGADAIVVIEIAWSSHREDRRKASVYAAGGVEVYWLVDLAARRLEVRTTPVDGAYAVTRVLGEDDVVELPETDARLTVRELLP